MCAVSGALGASESVKDEGRIDPAKRRRIMHMVVDLRLDRLARVGKIADKVKEINI